MNEKVKLPKFICDGINDLKVELSIKATESPTEIADFMEKLNHVNSEIHSWIYYSTTNQWDLFDALRYGYEAEPEPRWGIKAGNCYMDNTIEWRFDSIINTSATLDEFAYFTDKTEADDLVKTLGFGEVVDLNKEG